MRTRSPARSATSTPSLAYAAVAPSRPRAIRARRGKAHPGFGPSRRPPRSRGRLSRRCGRASSTRPRADQAHREHGLRAVRARVRRAPARRASSACWKRSTGSSPPPRTTSRSASRTCAAGQQRAGRPTPRRPRAPRRAIGSASGSWSRARSTCSRSTGRTPYGTRSPSASRGLLGQRSSSIARPPGPSPTRLASFEQESGPEGARRYRRDARLEVCRARSGSPVIGR